MISFIPYDITPLALQVMWQRPLAAAWLNTWDFRIAALYDVSFAWLVVTIQEKFRIIYKSFIKAIQDPHYKVYPSQLGDFQYDATATMDYEDPVWTIKPIDWVFNLDQPWWIWYGRGRHYFKWWAINNKFTGPFQNGDFQEAEARIMSTTPMPGMKIK